MISPLFFVSPHLLLFHHFDLGTFNQDALLLCLSFFYYFFFVIFGLFFASALQRIKKKIIIKQREHFGFEENRLGSALGFLFPLPPSSSLSLSLFSKRTNSKNWVFKPVDVFVGHLIQEANTS